MKIRYKPHKQKGSILDIIAIPLIIMVLFFAVVFVYMFLDQFATATMGVLPTQAEESLQAGLRQYLFWDQAMIILIGGLFVVSLIGAAMIDSHPIFFIGSVLFLIAGVFLASIITNIFMTMVGTPGIVNIANLYPLTVQFFQNLPLFVLLMGISIAVVMLSFGGKERNY